MLNDGEAERKARIAALYEEIDSISYANNLYWKQPSAGAKAEYYLRQDRLEDIWRELTELTK